MTEDRETLQKEAEAIKHRIESTRREAEQVAEHYNGQLKSLYEDLKVRKDALERLDGGKPTQTTWNVLPDRPLRIRIECAVDEDEPLHSERYDFSLEPMLKIVDDIQPYLTTIEVPLLSAFEGQCRCGARVKPYVFDPTVPGTYTGIPCQECGLTYTMSYQPSADGNPAHMYVQQVAR
jgi:hypothetical protein